MDEKGVYAEVQPDVTCQSPSRVRRVSTLEGSDGGCWSMSRVRKVSEQGAGLLCDTKAQVQGGKYQERERKCRQNYYRRWLHRKGELNN